MKTAQKRRRLPDRAVKLLIWCGPTLALILQTALVNVLMLGWVLDRSTIVTFCMIPLFGLIVTRLFFLFRSRRAGIAKTWRAAVWALLFVFLLVFNSFMPRAIHRSTRLDAQGKFEAKVSEILFESVSIPLELGSAESVVCHAYYTSAAVFESRSYVLLCRYDAANYEAEKASLETRYSYRTEPLPTEHPFSMKEEVKRIEPWASIGNDSFRFLWPQDGNDHDDFFKRCFLAVTNDVEQEIGYIIFQDAELDAAEDLTRFLNECCGWKCVRQKGCSVKNAIPDALKPPLP